MVDPIPLHRHRRQPGQPIAGALADHDPRDWRFSRTQREAGIEHEEWEERLPPPCRSHWLAALIALACPPDMLARLCRTALRPWIYFLACGLFWAIFALAVTGMMGKFAGL